MKTGIYIDGGYLRTLSNRAGIAHTPAHIRAVAHACLQPDERVLRILYYDCEPFQGNVTLPVSRKKTWLGADPAWLGELARMPLFAVRLGTLRYRGFKLKGNAVPDRSLIDEDFAPDLHQKGVDMRMGVDMVLNASRKIFERIILVCGDTDFLPAMRHARREGTQIVIVSLPDTKLSPELAEHSDYVRAVSWPTSPVVVEQ